MNDIHPQYLLYSLATLSLACVLASVFTSLRFTGDAGLPRLIRRWPERRPSPRRMSSCIFGRFSCIVFP